MNLIEECDFLKLSSENPITDFDCGINGLNACTLRSTRDFFNHKAFLFQQERLGQTYYFRSKETGKVVCAFSLSADSLKAAMLPGSRIKRVKELIPSEKALQTYPALLIGMLGVSVEFSSQGIGSLLNIIVICNFPLWYGFL